MCYEAGKGVSFDMKTAVTWYLKAADQNHPKAQNNLGVCYQNGDGVIRDLEKAAYWCVLKTFLFCFFVLGTPSLPWNTTSICDLGNMLLSSRLFSFI